MNFEGKRDRNSAYIKNEDGIFMTGGELIRERWVRRFYTVLNAKSSKLDPNITEGLD